MKRWEDIKGYIRVTDWSILFALCLLCFLLCMFGFQNVIQADIPKTDISIEYKLGKVSASLKGIEMRKALEDIGRKAGIEFVGLDYITGIIEEVEFKDLPLEDAIQKIGQNSIMIFRKEGLGKGEMTIKKVIILAHKEEEAPEPPPVPEPSPPLPPEPPIRPQPPPSVTRQEPPKPPPAVSRPVPKPVRPVPPPPPPPPPPKYPPVPVVPEPKPVQRPIPKPQTQTQSKIADANLSKGLKYFSEKRWDLAVKYLNVYLEDHPEDKYIQDRISKANQNAQEAIALYKSAKNTQMEGNLQQALELYKKSYALYPLLFDTWERIQDLKKKTQ